VQARERGFLLDALSFVSILNHMVKYQDEALDRTFAALSDPTRRALLARLGEQDSLSVSELAAPFPVSLPAIMKHLDVLTDAGLIVREKTGRTVSCRLTAQPMEQAMSWLNRYAQFWSDNLDRLAAFVEEETWPTQPSTPIPAQQSVQVLTAQASRSRAGSARGRKKSTPPGRKPHS
jgi:DNA-binding transcriptional ArsR family regulator